MEDLVKAGLVSPESISKLCASLEKANGDLKNFGTALSDSKEKVKSGPKISHSVSSKVKNERRAKNKRARKSRKANR